GRLASSLVSLNMSGNTRPTLSIIPDYVASVLVPFFITNSASDPDLNHLRYALATNAPVNARLNPETGLFAWTPSREQSHSTNLFTVTVTDDGQPPLSDTKSFTVIVRDYVEITAGSVVLNAGDPGT